MALWVATRRRRGRLSREPATPAFRRRLAPATSQHGESTEERGRRAVPQRPAGGAQTAGSEAASGHEASPPAAPRITFRLSSAHLRRVGEMSIPS